MIAALLVDPGDSIDFPGNEAEVMGRPLAAYPLLAAKGSDHAPRLYAQTVSQPVRRVAAQLGAVVLDPPRPEGQARFSDAALIAHGWRQIRDDLKAEKVELELLVLLFANTGAVSSPLIDEGIQALLDDAALDSAATVSPYPRWNPRRALREGKDGRLTRYADCAEDGDVPWFPDWGAQILRPRVLEGVSPSSPELTWLGEKIKPLKQAGGGPVDYAWQVPKMEYWLKKQGVRETARPEPMPKLQPAPKAASKPDRFADG